MKNKKLLIRRNEQEIIRTHDAVQAAIPLLQKMIKEAKEVKLEITKDNFIQAASKPEQFAKNQFLSDFKIGTHDENGNELTEPARFAKLGSIKTFDISGFIEAAGLFSKHPNRSMLTIEKGEAKIDQFQFEKLVVEPNSTYIYGPKEINIWEAYNKIFDDIKAFNALVKTECKADYGITLINWMYYAEWDYTGKETKLVPRLSTFNELKRIIVEEMEGV